MKAEDLRTLEALTELAFRRDMATLQPVLAREVALRQSLARLADQEASARAHPDRLALMRPMGADVTWQSWLSRSRRDLNTRLAAVLAEKEAHLARARRAFGRAHVASELTASASAKARQAQAALEHRRVLERLCPEDGRRGG
jgi:hypothetical protein